MPKQNGLICGRLAFLPTPTLSGAASGATGTAIPAGELAVVLPVHNEAAHLPDLLRGLAELADNIVMVDDGSSDQSAALALEKNIRVIRHPQRMGKTSSIRSALPSAIRSKWILFMDGDGQHDPSDLQKFWNARHGTDAVLGVRDLDSSPMPRCRRMANRLMSGILRRIAGGEISDTQCGYRLVRSSWIADWAPRGKEYEWESELYGRLMRTRARIRTVPVRTIYRQERSKIFWPRETWRFLKTCLRMERQAD